jgi:hypothetical protein
MSSGDKTPVIFYVKRKEAQHYAGPNHQYSDDNQVSSDHSSFTEVMVKGRDLHPRPLLPSKITKLLRIKKYPP